MSFVWFFYCFLPARSFRNFTYYLRKKLERSPGIVGHSTNKQMAWSFSSAQLHVLYSDITRSFSQWQRALYPKFIIIWYYYIPQKFYPIVEEYLPSMISYSTAFPTPESPSTAWTWTINEPWKGKRYRRSSFQVSSYWRKRSTSSTTVIASSWSNTFDECMFRPKVAWKYKRKCISWNTVYLLFVLWNGLEVNGSQETRRVITDIWNINDDRCLWLQRRISAILGKVKEIKN